MSRPARPSRRQPSRTAPASRHGSAATIVTSSTAAAGPERYASLAIVALLILTPLIVFPSAKETFRLGQGLIGGWLGLLSLAIASFALRQAAPSNAAALWRRPAVRALVPLAVLVAAGGFVTARPAHFRASAADFAIGLACLIGWSLALSAATLRRLLAWTIPPAVIVSALVLDQFAGWFGTLDWLNIQAPTARLRLTATVGNPGDVAALVVLPSLVILSRWRAAAPRLRIALAAALVLMLAALAATATLAATAAVLAGAIVWWWSSTPPRRGLLLRATLAGLMAIGVAGAIVVSSPLRPRVVEKASELARGDLNAVLTGRLDGWRVAWAMLRRAPATGVGQGAYRAEYADTRLALTDQGVPFYREQVQIILATPHNELLSVAAEQGVPGLIALAWALWCLWKACGVKGNSGIASGAPADVEDRALACAGLTALGVLAMVYFPLHAPPVAWPWLLFLAWVFRRADTAVNSDADTPHAAARQSVPVSGPVFAIVLAALLAALGWQTVRTHHRLEASRLLAQVEARTLAALQAKRAPSTMFATHLEWLERASRYDPLDVGVPLARGSQYFLLRRPDEAIAAYREAAALEPRPEIDLNLGRALWMKGAKDEARAVLRRAVKLDVLLRADVPPGAID